ncbi:hypothetical protein M1N63_00770 [Thermodesulfovibrionales bacterium]|nr:hypothetical protein [Thermodesulfovibrionales bacterium]
MYIPEVLTATKKGKVCHRCILLRESYRENGKVKNRTITNLTHCNPKEVATLRLVLAHKDDLTALKSFKDMELVVKNDSSCHHIPTPCQTSAKLLEAVNVRLPKVLPHLEANVVSRKKLQTRRISR